MTLDTTSQFPASLDSLTDPDGTTLMNATNYEHAELHQLENDAIENLQAKVGVDSSSVTTSIDYLLTSTSSVDPGHLHSVTSIVQYVKTIVTDSGSAEPTATTINMLGGEGIDTSGSGITVTIAGEDASTSNKGVASFSSSHFSVSSGAVSLVANGIDDTLIDWGTGTNQVSAVDMPIADAGSHYTGTEVETALQEIGAAADAHSMNGFETRSDSTLAWNNGTRVLTLASTGTTYYWIEAIRYSFASGADETITISDATGLHLIYLDSTPALQEIVNPSEAQVDDAIQNKCLVAMIYYNTTVSYDTGYVVADERHGTVMSPETHHWIHNNVGAAYKSGFAISAYTLDTATDAAVSYDLSDGELCDEDLEHDIENGTAANQYEQVLQGDAEVPVLMKLADGSWVEQAASTLPYVVDGSKDLQYMDTDNSWTQTTLGNSKFMLMWIVATNDWQYPIKAIQGSQEYNTEARARAGADTEIIDWGTLPSAEFVVLYQQIMKQANGTNVNGKIVDIIDFRFSKITGSSATAQDHGSLSGLSDDDHAQYLLVDGTRGVEASAPALIFKDTDCTDSDINAQILVAATDTGTGAEDVDVTFGQQVAGNLTTFLTSDADGSLTIGQSSQAVVFNSSAVTGVTTLTMAGDLTLSAGAARSIAVATDNTEGDALSIVSGSGGTGDVNGGALNLTGGAAGSGGANTGGSVTIAGGVDAGVDTGGSVTINGGAGDTNGSVNLGASNTALVTVGIDLQMADDKKVYLGTDQDAYVKYDETTNNVVEPGGNWPGWVAADETWTYASADAPSYTFTISSFDATTKYSAGMKVRLDQTTDGTKYYIITKVVYDNPGSTITVYAGTDYDLDNETISNPFYSTQRAPLDFPLDPDKWTIETNDSDNESQSNPTQNQWYNLGTITIDIPIGIWYVDYQACLGMYDNDSPESTSASMTLSTANNTESDIDWTSKGVLDAEHSAGGTKLEARVACARNKIIDISTKDTYYLNARTVTANQDQVFFRGDQSPTIIRAKSAYL